MLLHLHFVCLLFCLFVIALHLHGSKQTAAPEYQTLNYILYHLFKVNKYVFNLVQFLKDDNGKSFSNFAMLTYVSFENGTLKTKGYQNCRNASVNQLVFDCSSSLTTANPYLGLTVELKHLIYCTLSPAIRNEILKLCYLAALQSIL